ncbi:MAG: polysaccharide biosynthesis protein [Bacteroidales bacterium]|nr:polysaccharide biosynthesis protein [Bacteroidales bacterium]
MLDKLKNTLKHTVVYSLGQLSIKVIGLVLLPLYTAYLQPEQYGILALLETTSLFVASIFSVNISNAMMRWWADSDDEKQKKKFVYTGFIFLVFSSIVLNLLVQPFADKFALWLFDDEIFAVYFNILFISVAFDMLTKYVFSLMRVLEKSYYYIIVNSIKLVISLTLTIYFIVGLEMGVKGIILAQLVGNVAGFIALLPLLFKNLIAKIDYKALKEMLVYSIPLAFTALSLTIFNIGDRYVLKFVSGTYDVGIYSLAYKIAGFLNFFVLQSFQMGFLPIAYKMYKDSTAPRFFSKITTYLTMVMAFGALGLALFAPEFAKIFAPSNPKYWEAAQYVGLISVVVVLFGYRFMLTLNFHFAKKTLHIPFIVTFFAGLNILLNFLMIPEFGINGAVVSSIIATFLLNMVYYFVGRRFYKVDYKILKDILVVFVAFGLYLLTFTFWEINIWIGILLKLILLAIFPIIIVFFGFLEPIEKERLLQAWTKWKNPKQLKTNIKNLTNKNKKEKN